MSAENRNDQIDGKSQALRRSLMRAYTVKPIEDGRNSVWSKIGAAWARKDGEGYEGRMDALPVDGRIVLRTVNDRDDDQSGEVLDRTLD